MYKKQLYPVLLVLLIFFLGCTQNRLKHPKPVAFETLTAQKAEKIFQAAESYYSAHDVAQMRKAVENAGKAGPDTAVYHEIAANLAGMEDRRFDEFKHLVAALSDPGNDAPLIHLKRLSEMSWTISERKEIEQLCKTLKEHPDLELRSFAAYLKGISLFKRDDTKGMEKAEEMIGWTVPMALIGTWDNEQSKGFDIAYPPEHEIDLNKTYSGQLVEIGWRTDYARTRFAKTIDLKELLNPNIWAVAYLSSALRVQNAGKYELRLASTDALKVWVNDVLVFENRHIGRWGFDAIVIPVIFRPGVNRILIKSAQEKGHWRLHARLTGVGGAPVEPNKLKAVPADTPFTGHGTVPGKLVTEDALITRYISKIRNGVRRQYLEIKSAEMSGLKIAAINRAESFHGKFPRSISGHFKLAHVLWNNNERGRTSDLMDKLVSQAGDDLIRIRNKQARFWLQNNLKQKARRMLLETVKKHPDRPGAYKHLAYVYKTEKWMEDRLRILKKINSSWHNWPSEQLKLAKCYENLGYSKSAEAIYKRLLSYIPNDRRTITAMSRIALSKQDYKGAAICAGELTDAWPNKRSSWRQLGEILRKSGDRFGAEKAFLRIIKIAPTAPEGYLLCAKLAYIYGDRDQAVKFWQKALDRDPDNEKLANHLDFIAPPVAGPWATDVPGEKVIQKAIALRKEINYNDSADTVMLLDDMVTEVHSDGSSVNVVTSVIHVLNKSGRDEMTRFSMPGNGRCRILRAYSINSQGKRLEASSIRGRVIRFRKMEIGSTVVVQYRNDAGPNKFLAKYFTTQWHFQGYKTQFINSRCVLWIPKNTKILEFSRGDILREERKEGAFKRISWKAADTPVLTYEQRSPNLSEFVWMLNISTVPSWDLFHKWEEALLQNAFRQNPEIVRLSEALFKGANTPLEKLYRIQEYLISEIRYQRDYEHTVAGVKPHAAPVILARRYGDCKDKAVLFITLARLGGLDAQYALVRSRSMGQIKREVPMQQFNHAIVYIPAQSGLENGRFFDPTVDTLDVDLLRSDNQGTWAFVLDLRGGYKWRRIPFQSPEKDYVKKKITMNLLKNGNCLAEILITAKGRIGAVIRRAARNREKITQLMQRIANQLVPGAKMKDWRIIEATAVTKPASIIIQIEAPTFMRCEKNELRFKIPKNWFPSYLFSLAKRKHSLMMDVPNTREMEVEFILPEGAKFKRIPKSKKITSDNLSFERSFIKTKGCLKVKETLIGFCERISARDYTAVRNEVDKIVQQQEEEVVVTLP